MEVVLYPLPHISHFIPLYLLRLLLHLTFQSVAVQKFESLYDQNLHVCLLMEVCIKVGDIQPLFYRSQTLSPLCLFSFLLSPTFSLIGFFPSFLFFLLSNLFFDSLSYCITYQCFFIILLFLDSLIICTQFGFFTFLFGFIWDPFILPKLNTFC